MKTEKSFLSAPVSTSQGIRFQKELGQVATIFFLVSCCHFLLATSFSEGNKEIDIFLKEKTQQWIQSHPVRFLENKGQMVDMEGNPVPFVLFKAETPGMNLYITEKGITYLFVKSKEEYEKSADNQHGRTDVQLDKHSTNEKKNDDERKTEWERIDMDMQDAHIRKENIIKETASVTDFNFFLGHCPEGIYGVKEYEKITVKEIYPGIDWVLYNTNDKGFKYDFIVHPKADPRQIKIVYSSLNPLNLKKDGSLEIKNNLGALTEQAPYAYVKETKQEVITNFQIINQQRIHNQHYQTAISFFFNSTFNIRNSTLVIDPQLVWATFYGGNDADEPMSIDCDLSGNVFVTGATGSTDFPVKDPGGASYFQGTLVFNYDVFISKFTNSGVLVWSTYYGGAGYDYGYSICLDPVGNIFVTGYAGSGFPLFNPGGGSYFQPAITSSMDAFILKFDNSGVQKWGTYLGGDKQDIGTSVCVDPTGNIFLAGTTYSADFPVYDPGTGAYYKGTYNGSAFADGDIFISKFDNSGVQKWTTYYGGSGKDSFEPVICSDLNGNIFLTGATTSSDFPLLPAGGSAYFQGTYMGGTLGDAFILKFDNNGVRKWATYYGGTKNDCGFSICTDAVGNVFITGTVTVEFSSPTFPTLNPLGGAYFQANGGNLFILKFDNGGVRKWATVYGGNAMGIGYFNSWDNIATDACGNVYISCQANAGMPVQADCMGFYNSTLNGGYEDHFILKFDNDGVRKWATYFGGNGFEKKEPLAIDKYGNIFIIGTSSENAGSAITNSSYPLMDPGGGAYYDGTYNGVGTVKTDGFIAKFIPMTLTASSVESCFCTGTATASPISCDPPYTYSWSTSPIQTTQTATNLCSGTYTVTVRNACGNIQTATVVVTSTGGPTVNVSANTTIIQGQTATLTASGGNTYSWSPAASGTNGSSITVAPLITTMYCVIVTDANNCTDSACVTVTVIVESIDCSSAGEIYLPNSFSPNGDGENDKLRIYYGNMACLKTFKLVIYNRWGKKVFESTDPAFTWNGSYGSVPITTGKGKVMNTAVFVYYLKATLISGEEIMRKGNVNLMR